MLVDVEQLRESENRYKQAQGKPGRQAEESGEEMLRPKKSKTAATEGKILSTEENLAKRMAMIEEEGREPLDFAYERAIGNNDSVYSNFCELIAFVKQKVGRVVVKDGNRNAAFATGFMVSERLLLTNWHVFKDRDQVAQSEVEFFYEFDIFGRSRQPVTFTLNANDFFYSFKDLDYCFVAVNPLDVTGKIDISAIGYIYLDPGLGKLGEEGKELLNIIHHPNGDYKQLSIRENIFTKIMPSTLWYESDTSQGSSGSPVLNDQWQVVALHHMGVPSKSPDGKSYLDKAGKKIEPVDGKIDASRIHWIANEGIRISVILSDIFKKFPDSSYISALGKAPPPDSGFAMIRSNGNTPGGSLQSSMVTETTPVLTSHSNNGDKKSVIMDNNIQISFPPSLLEKSGSINVSISNRAAANIAHNGNAASINAAAVSGFIDEDLTEGKKIDREDAMDFAKCKGYQAGFLGTEISLPQPKDNIKKFVAKLKGSDATVLKYYHYSVIYHSVRMMPLLSAINVDGSIDKREDKSKRVDDWLRDNRMDYDIQLNDKYYSGSGFDRGHMSRREDANWGPDADSAKLFADITCMYTNACPQVAKLNQSKRGGLWGKLEILALEHGAVQEKGKTAKLSVFNGPIFKNSDGVFRGIQVPLEFFKIILWLNDKKELQATGFKLSQKNLVDDIDFEAIDIDANVEFKEYQCSIESLEKATHIDFSHIAKFDTFKKASNNGEESMELDSEEQVRRNFK